MTATRGAPPALSAPEPQEQSQTEHELSRGTCRRCAEVQHGGPS